MCWPAAENHWNDFLASHKEFKKELNDILIFGQNHKSKYIKIYEESNSNNIVYIYVQCGTTNLVKINIDCNMDSTLELPVCISADDVTIKSKLETLPCVKIMMDSLRAIQQIYKEDKVITRLSYNL